MAQVVDKSHPKVVILVTMTHENALMPRGAAPLDGAQAWSDETLCTRHHLWRQGKVRAILAPGIGAIIPEDIVVEHLGARQWRVQPLIVHHGHPIMLKPIGLLRLL